MASISAELKKAILDLGQKEKDKLLLRLVARDKLLIEQLEFQLLEDSATTEYRRNNILITYEKRISYSHSEAKFLAEKVRQQVKDINWHVKVTKDKYGDVELNLDLLIKSLTNNSKLWSLMDNHAHKLAVYLVKKANGTVKKLEKMDTELKLDFMKNTEKLLEILYGGPLKYYASAEGIPKEIEF